MSIHKGEPSEGLDFYLLLCNDDEFCKALGRAVLAAGRLESALTRYLKQKEPNHEKKRATLGQLISHAKKHEVFSDAMVSVLELLRDQRNYMTHNIHALFSGLIEETILGRTDLLDSDVVVFTERAWLLAVDLDDLAESLENRE